MSLSNDLIHFSSLFLVFLTLAHAATIEIQNNCPYTVWAAAVPGGGQQLGSGQSWTINVNPGTTQASIWGRTNCNFDASGLGRCQTGDCDGLLQCQAYGQSPNTLAEYASTQSNKLDHYAISLVHGFNIPMDFSPTTGGCRGIRCNLDINNDQCPIELQAPGGCNDPCTVFKTDEYCCNSGDCWPTNYSRFFKERCPDAYSYPKDDQTSTFTCPTGTNYRVSFCTSDKANTKATTFEVRNQCPYTIWAAAIPGGGQQLNPGQAWAFSVDQSTKQGRIWGRTNCNFDGSGHGRGRCQTGDCNGLLQCQAYGQPPNTLAEYVLNQSDNRDLYDVSLVYGFNIPMDFSPTTGGCRCVRCVANINSQCPNELRADGGCNNPCTVFKTGEYCCNSGNCGPTNFSRFFKERCGNAYSYPKDDQTTTFTCPTGTNYRVVFCP